MTKLQKTVFSTLFACSSLFGYNFETTFGAHDFIVNDIKTNGVPAHIDDGTSHTFGANVGIVVKHKTKSNINLYAKAEVLIDIDTDKLDKDHIPIWFDFIVDVDGDISKINDYNFIKWYVYLDDKQNTVSCIERQIRQHLGLGWQFNNQKLMFALNAYTGFYYIELDDDTPRERGYDRMDLDNGESSSLLEAEASYNFTNDFSIYASASRYSAHAGFSELETDFKMLLTYKTKDFIAEGTTLNLLLKRNNYNFNDFNEGHDLSILPWDNDSLVQCFISIPTDF